MQLSLKILVLLWTVNLAPPVIAHFLEEKWNSPLDGGRLFMDGKPILGPHKTHRGLAAACAMGLLVGLLLGFPWWVGLLSASLSMLGDVVSSFIKRRFAMPSGRIVPGLDQVVEGSLPFLILGPLFTLSAWLIGLLVALFSLGAFIGSWFLAYVLRMKPFESYPRALHPKVRLREFRSCQVTSKPLHHMLNFVDSLYYHILLKNVFRMLGIYEKGKKNALRVERCDQSFTFPELPESFNGYSILFLSDLHLDGLEGLTERLKELVGTQTVDLCIIGGDFRMETHGSFAGALDELRRLLPDIRARDGILGVLGNHDCAEIVEPLGELGLMFLVNDSIAINRGGEELWIVGVDDPHYFKCHDIPLAFQGVPTGAFTIFVAHSNEVYREVSPYDPSLYLCGHTHAGQIQIPGVGPVFTHTKAPRSFCWGEWRYGRMLGYTTCGAGVSGVPVRFASQGEVVFITLRRGNRP